MTSERVLVKSKEDKAKFKPYNHNQKITKGT